MQWIRESGGAAFGPDPVHAVDIIPHPQMKFPSWDEVAGDLMHISDWKPLGPMELAVLRRMYPKGSFSGFIAIGEKMAYRVILPADEPVLDALYQVETSEQGTPPEVLRILAAVMGHYWVYRLTRERRLPPWRAQLAAFSMVTILLWGDPPTRIGGRSTRRELEAALPDFLHNLFYHPETSRPLAGSPAGLMDKVRFWLLVARQLWLPSVLPLVFRSLPALPRDLQNAIISAAEMYAFMHPNLTYEGVPLPIRNDTDAFLMYIQMLEWSLGGADGDVVEWSLRHPQRIWPAVDEPDGEAEGWAHTMSEMLREEARRKRVYAPTGTFVLELPDDIPLRTKGATALRLLVDEEGMWVQLLDEKGEGSVVARWDAEVGLYTTPFGVGGAEVDVVLAAIWRDMVVEGQRALPPSERASTYRTGDQGKGKAASRQRRRKFPRASGRSQGRSLRLEGVRQWGTQEERERIRRRAHAVAGHLRRLLPGQHASEMAREAARRAGILLPPGKTWVRPHVRGKGAEDEGTHEEAPIVCAGLMQLVAHYRQNHR